MMLVRGESLRQCEYHNRVPTTDLSLLLSCLVILKQKAIFYAMQNFRTKVDISFCIASYCQKEHHIHFGAFDSLRATFARSMAPNKSFMELN
jgi:hypothetical protein